MQNEKFTTILCIPNMDESTLMRAHSQFLAFSRNGVIRSGNFDDSIWMLTDEYANVSFDFSVSNLAFRDYKTYLSMDLTEFVQYLKTYMVFQLGCLSLVSLQGILNCIKLVVSHPVDMLTSIIDERHMQFIDKVSELFSILPLEGREAELECIIDILDAIEDRSGFQQDYGQRKLASFESYFLFGDILDTYWENTEDEDEKLFFFPVYMWWKITGVVPVRPREFVLTPRNCIKNVSEEWVLFLRKNNIKGQGKAISYKINDDYRIVSYPIPSNLAEEINWYRKATAEYYENELDTLFARDIHYAMWERRAPHNSRYFTYINMSTCLRYFFEQIVRKRYGFEIIFDRNCKHLKENQIQYLNLGDTRHLSLINIIAEGATPMVAMILAGHDNPDMSSHYYSNITNLIECRTYRQYKKMIKGETSYSISKTCAPLKVSKFITVNDKDGLCYSSRFAEGDFTDCAKVSGPAGEIGYCENCTYYRSKGSMFENSSEIYRSQIKSECRNLERIVKQVRQQKGESEEIMQALLNLRSYEYSYQQYLEETMGSKHGEK